MDSEPRWLDIEDELYPQIVMVKQIVFEDSRNGELTEFCSEITYNSFKREIDLTPVIYKYFIQNSSKFQHQSSKNQSFEICILDKVQEKLCLMGFFPHDDAYTLGQQFLSEEILYLIIKNEQKMNSNTQSSASLLQKTSPQYQIEDGSLNQQQKPCLGQSQFLSKQQDQCEQGSKAKPNKRRTIEQILKIVAEWRKLILIKKLSSAESAEKVGMSKRSLEDYFTTIKLAQKYGFDFQTKMKNGFAELRNFVKENHEIKPISKVQILEKFKNIKK